ncbi:MAG: HD domain-containing protein [Bacilli bacterium]|nr:HD domain-containing protein [Bacilli bacterium]
MKINSKEARELLEKERKNQTDDRWINHSICVGDSAGRIAKALQDKGIDVDVDKAITLGYIHDIGKRFNEYGGVFPHAINGYNYIKELGYDEEYAGICIKHSFLNNDIDCISNDRDETDKTNPNYNFVKDYISNEYSIEEKIINLCDLMCTTKTLTVEKRMIDLLLRHGVFKKTHYHIEETMKLKEYFDNLLGYNLYDLFPEIKGNL